MKLGEFIGHFEGSMRQAAQKRREVEESIPHEQHRAVGIKNYMTAQPNNGTFKL